MADIQSNRERFRSILQATGRDGIDYILEDLDTWGFFEAPASARNHFNFPGGLAEHSLNVYDMAMALRGAIVPMRADMEKALNPDSIAIAALLHDVCKTNIYRRTKRKQRNEIGVWEEIEGYEVDYTEMPVGHGEKSVIMLLRSGLDLEDEEIFAIRWHMGFSGPEDNKLVGQALQQYPLAFALATADMEASYFLEKT